MNASQPPELYLALIHHPVVDKNGNVIASAVTNLDVHDIARTAKTYGIKSFYIVTPLADQKILVERIVSHWTRGSGAKYNPKRRQALELVKVVESIDLAVENIRLLTKQKPKTIATSARMTKDAVSFGQLRRQLKNGEPHLLLFGTAWGLSEELLRQVDYRLTPISGPGNYNHLPVRCAAAIILDRLLLQN